MPEIRGVEQRRPVLLCPNREPLVDRTDPLASGGRLGSPAAALAELSTSSVVVVPPFQAEMVPSSVSMMNVAGLPFTMKPLGSC